MCTYSWRVPTFIAGELTAHGRFEPSNLVPAESRPATYCWRWYYGYEAYAMLVGILVLPFGLRRNRRLQTLLLFTPLVIAGGALWALAWLADTQIARMLFVLQIAPAFVLLSVPLLARLRWFVRAPVAWLIAVSAGVVATYAFADDYIYEMQWVVRSLAFVYGLAVLNLAIAALALRRRLKLHRVFLLCGILICVTVAALAVFQGNLTIDLDVLENTAWAWGMFLPWFVPAAFSKFYHERMFRLLSPKQRDNIAP